jgi:hypothetical protein
MSRANRFVIGDGNSLCDGETYNQGNAIATAKQLTDDLDSGEIVTVYELVPFRYIKKIESIVVVNARNTK